MKNKTVVLNEHLSEEYKEKLSQNSGNIVNEQPSANMPEDFGFEIKNVKPHRYGIISTIIIFFIIIAGLVLIICGAVISSTKGKPHGKYTQQIFAEISTIYAEKNTKKDTIEYYPEVHYYVDGTEYKIKSTKPTEYSTYTEGQQIEIIYNPDQPDSFQILAENDGKSESALVFTGIIFMIFGFVVFMIKSKSNF